MADLCKYVIEVEEDGPCQTCGHGGRVHPGEGDWDEVTPPEERPAPAFCIFCEVERESVDDRRQFHPYQPPLRRCEHSHDQHAVIQGQGAWCSLCNDEHPFTAEVVGEATVVSTGLRSTEG